MLLFRVSHVDGQLSELQADLSRLRSSNQRSSYLADDPEVRFK
jgi:hypothetical protein